MRAAKCPSEKVSREKLAELIERLRQYSEEEYGAHNNYIAEDLKDAADILAGILSGEVVL